MTLAAQAQGSAFLIGVRFHNGSWFARCDFEEVDGASPADAVWSLIDILYRKAEHEQRRLDANAKGAEQRRIDLHDIYLATWPKRNGSEAEDAGASSASRAEAGQ